MAAVWCSTATIDYKKNKRKYINSTCYLFFNNLGHGMSQAL
jgi:hypothetical protein